MWSKPFLYRFRQSKKIQQTQVSQGFAGFRLAMSRIPPRHTQIKRDTNFATPGYTLSCHDTTARGKNKVFSVCGHLCGQSRFCAAFGNQGKSRKRRCRKALRRFALPYPGYNHGTPKPHILSTEPYLNACSFYQTFELDARENMQQTRKTVIIKPSAHSYSPLQI